MEWLGDLAESLAASNRWKWRDTINFVLTDQPPQTSRLVARAWLDPAAPHNSRLDLEVRWLLLGRRELSKLVDDALRRLSENDPLRRSGRKNRPLPSKERATLAVFVAQRNDGRTWREVMAEWNRARGRRRYRDPRQFTRDARLAYERITGAPLAWAGARRKGEGKP